MGCFLTIDSLIPLDEHFATFQGMDIEEMDKRKDKTGQNRARDQKEHEITSPAVLSDFIGPARNPFNGPDQPK
ncbi:hypothetical protein Tco_0110936 [Tanacetum coccineum]